MGHLPKSCSRKLGVMFGVRNGSWCVGPEVIFEHGFQKMCFLLKMSFPPLLHSTNGSHVWLSKWLMGHLPKSCPRKMGVMAGFPRWGWHPKMIANFDLPPIITSDHVAAAPTASKPEVHYSNGKDSGREMESPRSVEQAPSYARAGSEAAPYTLCC